MKRYGRCFSLAALVLAEVAWGVCAPEFPDTTGKIVQRGDGFTVRLVESSKKGIKTAEAIFTVASSSDACRKVITDYVHYPEFMPNIKTAKPASDAPAGIVRWTFALNAGLKTIGYTIDLRESSVDSVWSMAWTYVRGDIRNTAGSWTVTLCSTRPERTLIRYRVCVDAGKFVPAFVSTMLTTQSIPGLIKAIRERTK